MLLMNQAVFQTVVAAARRSASPARQRAIDKAVAAIEAEPYIDATGSGLLILSPYSLNIYNTAGTGCECIAAGFDRFCWHRAAAQLWDAYKAELARLARPTLDPAAAAAALRLAQRRAMEIFG